MTTTVDPNLTEQRSFLTCSEFSQKTGVSRSMVNKGCLDGTIRSVRVTKDGRHWIPKSEAERFMGMKTSAPRGIAAARAKAEESQQKQFPTKDDLSPALMKLRDAIGEMKDTGLLVDKLKKGLGLAMEGLTEIKEIVERNGAQ